MLWHCPSHQSARIPAGQEPAILHSANLPGTPKPNSGVGTVMNSLTDITEGCRISWSAIWANKMRAILTTLGIIIGIVTVTLMGTAIDGLNNAFMKSLSFIGADVLFVQRFGWFLDSHEEWLKAERRRPLTLVQFKELEKQTTLARAIAPVAESRASIRFKNSDASDVKVLGTTDQFLQTGGVTLTEGRFFSSAEAESGRPVCVIGATIATNLFVHGPALGNKLRLGPTLYEVIGVLEKQGDMGPLSHDNDAIVPLRQFINDFRQWPDIQIQVKAADLRRLDDAKEELRFLLRKIRRVAPGVEDDFSIDQQETFLTMYKRVAGSIAAVGLFITGLSLFVGGIGIMNIMFVSVAERTREIGIRKAIGAKRRTILLQFLIEAASICLLGGALGLAIAYPLTLVMAMFIPATMSFTVVSIALLVSLFTGVLSGFFPAWRAARMNPVDALRNE